MSAALLKSSRDYTTEDVKTGRLSLTRLVTSLRRPTIHPLILHPIAWVVARAHTMSTETSHPTHTPVLTSPSRFGMDPTQDRRHLSHHQRQPPGPSPTTHRGSPHPTDQVATLDNASEFDLGFPYTFLKQTRPTCLTGCLRESLLHLQVKTPSTSPMPTRNQADEIQLARLVEAGRTASSLSHPVSSLRVLVVSEWHLSYIPSAAALLKYHPVVRIMYKVRI
ncbi:uncharacterized protein L203_105877 [Cryptococcus depauperatus CBS 7841]|uniref:Uncharacterized protein n=1 Tax=Cryptococcus depauperatus CBS 7841 TaxID=1295531 RepID=A0AAJ8JXZ1_9TREE